MKFAAAFIALAASTVSAQDYNQSAPFALKLEVKEFNGKFTAHYLNALHAGAAIEALGLGGAARAGASTYTHNYTDYNIVKSYLTGPLVYVLQGSGFNASSGMSFVYNPSSNVVTPLFMPGTGSGTVNVGFDSHNKMFVASYSDEKKFKIGERPAPQKPQAIYSWYACMTTPGGYYYDTLAWVLDGAGSKPTNPTCRSATVFREFV